MALVNVEENTAGLMETRHREGIGGKTGMERGGLRTRCILQSHAMQLPLLPTWRSILIDHSVGTGLVIDKLSTLSIQLLLNSATNKKPAF